MLREFFSQSGGLWEIQSNFLEENLPLSDEDKGAKRELQSAAGKFHKIHCGKWPKKCIFTARYPSKGDYRNAILLWKPSSKSRPQKPSNGTSA
ncbi:MAG: hypothetical protein SH848_12425 [Saprospiraceae bacterium]|nr:hypothetical protein [Saprospiraceae bacterium]MDZ4704731.1 hypothetical protein [Saprospiraceae bacterium]